MRKINIENGIEQVLAYTPSGNSDETMLQVGSCGAIPVAKKEEAPIAETLPPAAGSDLPTEDGLPF